MLRPFSRVTTSGRFIPEIDGLRFVAIMFVVVFHLAINLQSRSADYALDSAPGWVSRVVLAGDFGVQLFFIVSGFVLALPFARHHLLGSARVSLTGYFLRRVTRLEPPYVITMVLAFLILVVMHGGSASELFPHLLASLGYVHTLVFGHDSVINNVAWSLEVEIQFYLLVPWLTAVFAIRSVRHRRALIAAAIVFCSLVGPLVAGTTPHLENTILRFAQYFLVGFLLADLWVSEQLKPDEGRRNLAWDGLALIALVVGLVVYTGATPATLALVVLPWLCLLAYVAVFRGVVLNSLLTLPLISTIGGMCYSIYLWHNILLNNTLGATAGFAPFGGYLPDLLVQAVVMVPLVIVFSAVFFVLIERPCMDKDWPAKLWGRLTGNPRVAAEHLPTPEQPTQPSTPQTVDLRTSDTRTSDTRTSDTRTSDTSTSTSTSTSSSQAGGPR